MLDGDSACLRPGAFQVQESRIEQTACIDPSHSGQEGFLDGGVVALEFGNNIAQAAAHGAGFLRAAARNDGRAKLGGEGSREIFGNVDERADEAELALARPGDRRQGGGSAGKQRVAQERLAKIIRRMAEGNHVGTEFSGEVVDGAAAETAAEIAAMAGLFVEQPQRGSVLNIGPIDTALAQIGANRFDGREEFALFDGEGTHAEFDGGALLQGQQRFEQCQRIFSSGDADGHAVAIANHAEAADRLADFAENGFFEIHFIHDTVGRRQ